MPPDLLNFVGHLVEMDEQLLSSGILFSWTPETPLTCSALVQQ
jgi:hypothetical protein